MKGIFNGLVAVLVVVLGIIVMAALGSPLNSIIDGIVAETGDVEAIFILMFIPMIVVVLIVRGLKVSRGEIAPEDA